MSLAAAAPEVAAVRVVSVPPVAAVRKSNAASVDAAALHTANAQDTAAAVGKRVAGDLAWLSAAANPSWPDLQGQKQDFPIAALDAALADYGA